MRFEIEGVEFGQKRCEVECSNVSAEATNWKNSLLKPWGNVYFSTLSPIFPLVPLKNLALLAIYKFLFSIELLLCKVFHRQLETSGSI